jgi:hypothetical protein
MKKTPYKPLIPYTPAGVPRLRFRWIGMYSPAERKTRLFKVIRNKGLPGLQGGHSAFVSVSLMPGLFRWARRGSEWRLTVLGLSVHYRKSTSGRFV